jgi:triphosphatase
MEIEAKYRLMHEAQIEAVTRLNQLGSYALQVGDQEDQHNTYFDSVDGRLQRAHYGLRRRVVGERSLITLKGPNTVEDGVHRRDEWEFLSDTPQPAHWPAGEARDVALGLLGNAEIIELLSIATQRRSIQVTQGKRFVAVIALDQGVINAAGHREPILELEIELAEAGTLDDIAALADALRAHIPVVPEPRSKLERGLALLAAST